MDSKIEIVRKISECTNMILMFFSWRDYLKSNFQSRHLHLETFLAMHRDKTVFNFNKITQCIEKKKKRMAAISAFHLYSSLY